MVVFFCSFTPAVIASLAYVFLRPPEYRSVARLQIAPAAVVAQPIDAQNTPTVSTDAKSFLTEVQVLTSRPLLKEALQRLKDDGPLPELGADPIEGVQRMLQVQPVADTQVVEVVAEGPQQQFLPRLVNTIIDAYRQHVVDAFKAHTSSAYSDLSNEVGTLEGQVAERRRAIDAFGARYDIVSLEHKENDVLARIEGLNRSYTDATNRLATAQAHLKSLRAAAAAGRGVVKAKDDPTLADLERRASALQEQWREYQRRYTPGYLAIDPNAISLRARLDDLQQQLTSQHAASVQAALTEAEEDVSAAQNAVEQLRSDVTTNQQQAKEFAAHLNEYKALREDLDHVEAMHRAALDRLTKLQSSELERAPHIELVEAAAPSHEPWRPNYRLDALIAGAASLAFGLFAIWFTELIVGRPASTGMLVQHTWVPTMLGSDKPAPSLPLATTSAIQLPAPEPLPRELSDVEIASLVTTATESAQLAVVALLMGLTEEELVALRWNHVDLPANVIRVSGRAARNIPLMEPLRGLLISRRVDEDAALVLHNGVQDGELEIAEISRLILYAAYDARLDRPDEVTPAALRYTYLCSLIRQGIRAADIADAMGHVPQQELIACIQTHAPRERRPLELIDRVLPVLRKFAGDVG
jgi:uncharacterized protein involved in exopolysaccharide biosynthesis